MVFSFTVDNRLNSKLQLQSRVWCLHRINVYNAFFPAKLSDSKLLRIQFSGCHYGKQRHVFCRFWSNGSVLPRTVLMMHSMFAVVSILFSHFGSTLDLDYRLYIDLYILPKNSKRNCRFALSLFIARFL